jgi:hypothetical protein
MESGDLDANSFQLAYRIAEYDPPSLVSTLKSVGRWTIMWGEIRTKNGVDAVEWPVRLGRAIRLTSNPGFHSAAKGYFVRKVNIHGEF